MRKKEITEEDILKIMNDKLGIEYWELELGIGLQYEDSPSEDIRYSAPYSKMGKKLWKASKSEIYELICDRKQRTPQEWLNELISGDIRNLIVGISSAITAKYEVTLGIALPVAALVIKSNILTYCKEAPKKSKRSVIQVLKNKD